MRNKNQEPTPDTGDLEKKVDQMMAPDTLEKSHEPVEAVGPTASAVQPVPTGVPAVPHDIAKELDAFSVNAPDITAEQEPQPQVALTPEGHAALAAETSAEEQAHVGAVLPPEQPNDSINNPATDEAVTDIVRQEADTVLDAEDMQQAGPQKRRSKHKMRWWRDKRFIYGLIISLCIGLCAVMVWPTSRYAVFNAVGVRSKASVKIVDTTTKLPLRGVEVTIGNAKAITNDKGVAAFDMVRLGEQKLRIDRIAFAPVQKNITLGWGSNPLGEVALRATGVRYEVHVSDFASGKSLQAEARSGDAAAVSDKQGVIKLVLEDVDKQTVDIIVQAEGYRSEKITVAADKKQATHVVMVPSKPVVYISKQSGKYDVYAIDADGKNKRVLLAGTGRETQDIKIATSPDGATAAVVSARGTKRDSNGNILQSLTLIDIKTAATKTLDDANTITLVDWVNQQLIYVATYTTDDKNTSEQRLISYDVDESARHALATAAYFSAAVSNGGYVYFASIQDDPEQQTAFQKIRIDGSGKQVIVQDKVLSVVRTDFASLRLETQDGWLAYTFGASEATKSTPPEIYVSRQYTVSPNGMNSVWLDNRDGKGTIIVRDQTSTKETVLTAYGGIMTPLRWLNDTTVLYRVSNLNETADYVKSTQGGDARKISDVTHTTGLGSNL